MKRLLCVVLFVSLVVTANAQEEKVFITGFEFTEELTGEWAWTGGAFQGSFVDLPTSPQPVEGEAVLVVFYDNGGSEWQHGTLNFAIPPVDISGMREIRMSVYFTPESTGTLQIRLDLPNGNILGFASVPSAGEWHELVWKIDRKTSVADFMSALSYVQGFIVPTPGSAAGEVWLDNVYAFRPADIPAAVDEILVYGFNTADPETGAPVGWTRAGDTGYMPEMAAGLAEPSEGSDSMAMFCWSGYLQNVRTTNALEAFDRWAEALEIQFDVRTPTAIPGGWMQSRIRIRSGIGDDASTVVEFASKEIGYYDAVNSWKTLLWEVDMTNHIPNIEAPGGWLEIRIDTNQNASADGAFILVDNFRVTVPREPVGVSNWSLY
ncbi:MAG: hypothetical protein C4527_02490 [Candidatus Omnitrophota bacterium]|jgi:hypothetical protein|nr:MAG: hypothetical protein C4527_02490 [Candidatus Omnitrophota bacterium]